MLKSFIKHTNISLILSVLIAMIYISGCGINLDLGKIFHRKNSQSQFYLNSSPDEILKIPGYRVYIISDFCNDDHRNGHFLDKTKCDGLGKTSVYCSGVHISDGYVVSSASCFFEKVDLDLSYIKPIRELKYLTKINNELFEVYLNNLFIMPVIHQGFLDWRNGFLGLFFIDDIAMFYLAHHQNIPIADKAEIYSGIEYYANNIPQSITIEANNTNQNSIVYNNKHNNKYQENGHSCNHRFDFHLNAHLYYYIDVISKDGCELDLDEVLDNHHSSDFEFCAEYFKKEFALDHVNAYQNNQWKFEQQAFISDGLRSIYIENEQTRYLLLKLMINDYYQKFLHSSLNYNDQNLSCDLSLFFTKHQISLMDPQVNIVEHQLDNITDLFDFSLLDYQIIEKNLPRSIFITSDYVSSVCRLINNDGFNLLSNPFQYSDSLICDRDLHYKCINDLSYLKRGSGVIKKTPDKNILVGVVSTVLPSVYQSREIKSITQCKDSAVAVSVDYYQDWIATHKQLAYHQGIITFFQ